METAYLFQVGTLAVSQNMPITKVMSVIELGEETGNSQQRKVLLERLMYLDSFNALSTYRSKFDSKVYR